MKRFYYTLWWFSPIVAGPEIDDQLSYFTRRGTTVGVAPTGEVLTRDGDGNWYLRGIVA